METRTEVNSQHKPLPLTSENLKNFDKQFQRSGNLYLRQKIPQRTAADGKSAPASPHNEQNHTNKNNEDDLRIAEENEKTLYRPKRDSYRRNPEGRSQNGSSIFPRLGVAKKVYYYDDTDDYRIPYEDPSYVAPQSRASEYRDKNGQGIAYETSSYTSSSVTEVVRTKKKKRSIVYSDEGSMSSSTSAGSDDDEIFDDFDDDDDDDDSTEDEATTITKQASTVQYSRSSSSITISSIPTNPPSPSQESVTSNGHQPHSSPQLCELLENKQKQDQKMSVACPNSSVPKHETPMTFQNSLKEKKFEKSDKSETKKALEEIRTKRNLSSSSGSSIGFHSNSVLKEFENTSRKDSLSSVRLSRESYITIRNWTLWGQYSRGGYSITDKIIPPKNKKSNRPSNASSITSLSNAKSTTDISQSQESDQSRSSMSFLETRSVQSLRIPIKFESPQPKEFLSSEELSISSGTSTTKLEMTRAKSLPHTNVYTQENKRTSGVQFKKEKRRETENDVYGVDFKNKTKNIPKLRDRSQRPKAGLKFADYKKEDRTRKKKRRRAKNNEKEQFTLTNREGAESSVTTSSYTAPLYRKARLLTLPQKPKSSVSTTTDCSLSRATSAASTGSFYGRRIKTVLQPLNLDDSGFATNRSPSSNCESVHPLDTPFTPVLRKTSALSLLSIASECSSFSSIYRESDSCLSRSASSLSILSDDAGSTTIGPDKLPSLSSLPSTPKEAEKKQIQAAAKPKLTPKKVLEKGVERSAELPPVVRTRHAPLQRRKSSPYYSSMSPAILTRIQVLRTAIKKAETKKKKYSIHRRQKVFRINHPMPSFEEAYRDHGMQRLIKLAKPKDSKAIWATSFWPVRWGDQTMIFPLSKSAMKFQTTPRLGELAVPKKDFRNDYPETCARDAFQYSCGRSSVILEVSPLAMSANATARVAELAKHKMTMKEHDERAQRASYIFSCGRSSPIWDVGQPAKTADDRERTMQLAQPKKPDSRYQPERPTIWPVSPAARRASPSPRTEMLARPKTRSDALHREPTWIVSSAARRTVASARVQELAKPKQTAEGYEPCKELEQPLSRKILRASATERIKTLSKPMIRETMDHVQFNPDAFKVSETALKGRVPERVVELAQPLSRK